MTAAIGSASAGNQQPDEVSGNIPALPLGDARISQHAAANGAHAMSKLAGRCRLLSATFRKRVLESSQATAGRPA
jgi:hypothetical protein